MIRGAFDLSWVDFKSIIDAKSLVVQWIDVQNTYYLFASDGIFPIRCDLNRSDPNASEEITDFENNYKANGNKPILRTGLIKKNFAATTQQTNATVWAPASGKRIVLTGYQFSIHNNTALTTATAQLFDNANSAGNIIYSNMSNPGANFDVAMSLNPPIPMAAVDNAIKATTSAAIRVAGVLFGFEV